MATLSAADIDEPFRNAIRKFSPARNRKRLTGWLVGAGIVAYLVFAWWFFAVGAVLAAGNWGIAGVYLADWVSYEMRPEIELQGRSPGVGYPRFSSYRADRQPDWMTHRAGRRRNAGRQGAGEACHHPHRQHRYDRRHARPRRSRTAAARRSPSISLPDQSVTARGRFARLGRAERRPARRSPCRSALPAAPRSMPTM